MATLKEITYDIREKLELSSDDSNVTNRYIQYLININRAKLIKQRLGDIRRNVAQSYKQEINLTLENYKDPLDNTLVRSVQEVPRVLDINSIDNRTVLSNNSDVVRTFTMVTYKRLPYTGVRKHLSHLIYGAIADDDKLYLKSGDDNFKLLTKIKLWGVWENPEDAYNLSPDYDSTIPFEDTEYPVEPSLIPDITASVINQLGITFEINEDKVNNGEEGAA